MVSVPRNWRVSNSDEKNFKFFLQWIETIDEISKKKMSQIELLKSQKSKYIALSILWWRQRNGNFRNSLLLRKINRNSVSFSFNSMIAKAEISELIWSEYSQRVYSRIFPNEIFAFGINFEFSIPLKGFDRLGIRRIEDFTSNVLSLYSDNISLC